SLAWKPCRTQLRNEWRRCHRCVIAARLICDVPRSWKARLARGIIGHFGRNPRAERGLWSRPRSVARPQLHPGRGVLDSRVSEPVATSNRSPRGVIMNRTFQRTPQVESAPLNDEAILLNPTTSSFFMLNRTSSFIWDQLSKPTTAESLADQICETFDDI